MSIAALPAERAIRPIPLSALALAPENVRKTAPHPADEASLKASIASLGLLENLLVRECAPNSEGAGRFTVIAGGRRLAALQALHADGTIPADYQVPCLIADNDDNPGELSLVENVVRIPMHPADQVTAFTDLVREGLTVSTIAARFGASERLVEQRLRLGNAAPIILDAYRADDIDLKTLQSFAVTTDHERQLAVWNQVRDQGHRPTAWQVKRMLTEERVPGRAAIARFVGVEAYEAAGGSVLRDLFADDDEAGIWFEDAQLLNTLATRKLTVAADELATRWSWSEAALDLDWNAAARFSRVHPLESAPTDEENARLDVLRSREEELAAIYNGDGEQWTEAHEHELATIEAEIEEIEFAVCNRATYSPEALAMAGCIATIGEDGALEVIEGLVRPEDIPARTSNPGSNGASDTGQPPTPIHTPAQGRPVDPAAAVRKEAGVGIGLSEDLTAIRTGIVKAHLAGDFPAAFDLMLFQLARSVFAATYMTQAFDISTRLTAERPFKRGNDDFFADWSPGEAMLEDRSHIPLEWLTIEDDGDSFAALRALPKTDKQSLFAASVARTLTGQLAFEHRALPQFEATVARLDIDFASHVRPTADMFWTRITKGRILEIARATLGPDWAIAHANFKKTDLAAAMEAAFAKGSTPLGVTPASHAAALAWSMPGFPAYDDGQIAAPLEEEPASTQPAVSDDPAPEAPADDIPAPGTPAPDASATESAADPHADEPDGTEASAKPYDPTDTSALPPELAATIDAMNAIPTSDGGPRVMIAHVGPINGHDAGADLPEFLRNA